MIRGIQNLKKYIGKVETFFMTFIFAAAFVIIMLQAVSVMCSTARLSGQMSYPSICR